MKSRLFLALILIIGLFSCEKDDSSENFQILEFKNLRLEPHSSLTLVDSPRTALWYEDHGGIADTLGETKLFYRGDLIAHRDWETTYMSPLHYKTEVLYTFGNEVMVVLIHPDYSFSDRLYVMNNSFKKEFFVTIGEIKLVEIDEARRILRITHNDAWIRTGPLSDETQEFNY